MNKRIEELAEQAGFKHPDHVGLCEEYAYFDHIKFAELIVRECSRMADRWVDDTDNGQNYPSEIIKQHFGFDK